MIFDTHAHYDDEQFDADRDALLAAMPAAGVGLIVDPGCDLASSRAAVALARRFPHVYAAVGWHPENCAPFDPDAPEQVDALRALAREPKVVAIGEIGLDYHWAENPPKAQQHAVLRRQLALAVELDLPVIIHDRDAHADCFAIVCEFPALRGVFHCYSGSVELARELWKRGWFVGFDGPLTYKNARKTVEVAAEAPLERILIETDAPYLAPVPRRGTRNDSRNLRFVAEKLAELRGMTSEQVIALTAENGKRLFGIA
ncbi:MAG: TatD family hydrolase [Oscillospiraceae bacterium]|nr:TatD family hydrolase [Oscillospiraceae bacterium]